MRVYVCRLVFHESLYYATREVGRLYETEGCLHNYALTYALGLAAAPYFQAQQVPHYVEELTPLNERGIYITPARGVEVQYTLRRLAITTYPAFVRCSRYCKAWRRQIGQVILARLLTTFKYASNLYHVEMKKGSRNTPSFGRAKEVGVGSVFEFAAFSEQEPLTLPPWVRLGLWRSKAALTWEVFDDVRLRSGRHTVAFPLNPLDVDGHFLVFDLLSMAPVSLVQHAQMEGEYYELPNGLQFPVGMQYFKTPFPAVRVTVR